MKQKAPLRCGVSGLNCYKLVFTQLHVAGLQTISTVIPQNDLYNFINKERNNFCKNNKLF